MFDPTKMQVSLEWLAFAEQAEHKAWLDSQPRHAPDDPIWQPGRLAYHASIREAIAQHPLKQLERRVAELERKLTKAAA